MPIVSYEPQSQEPSVGTTGDSSLTQEVAAPLAAQLKGLEVGVNALREKLEGEIKVLNEKLGSNTLARRWFIATILTAIIAIFSVGVAFYNFITDSNESFRDIQKDYYSELVNMQKLYNSSTDLDIFKNCLKNGGWNVCLNQ